MIVRINSLRLESMQPVEMGMIDLDLALDLRRFCDTVRSLAPSDLKLVKAALDEIIETLAPPF